MTGIDYRAPPLEQQVTLLARTLPDGRLWNAKYDQTRVFGRLVAAFAQEISRTFQTIANFVLTELDPAKTRQLILEWEESVGIPDECFDRSADLTERRRRIVQKRNNFGDIITRADIENLLLDFGEQIQLVTGTEANAELLGFPAPPYDTNQLKQIKHTVAVRVTSDAEVFPLDFPFPFATEQSSLLRCLVRRVTPANVALQFFFNENLNQPFGGPNSVSIVNALAAPTQAAAVKAIAKASAAHTLPAPTQAAVLIGPPSFVASHVLPAPTQAAALSSAPDIALLDAWTNVSTAIGTPGSKPVSAGANRLELARTSSRAGSAVTVTALSYGGQPMTLVDEEITITGPDFHTALWSLDEAGIAAASGTAFSITPSSGATQFRLQAGSYENVDQLDPIVDNFSVNADSGGNPTSQALTTVAGGKALAIVGANRGSDDLGATEDAAYSNMTERVEVIGTQSYNSIADADTDGTNFTPGTTVTHQTVAHLIGVSLRKA